MEIVRIANKVDIDIGRCMNRLSTFAPSNDFLELGARRLDLSARVLWISYLLVRINFDKVVVTLKDCSSLVRVINVLELHPFLNACAVFILLLSNIIIIEARCVIDGRTWLDPAFRLCQV